MDELAIYTSKRIVSATRNTICNAQEANKLPSNANEICQLPPSNHVDILETVLSIYNKKIMTNKRQKRLLSCHYIVIEAN